MIKSRNKLKLIFRWRMDLLSRYDRIGHNGASLILPYIQTNNDLIWFVAFHNDDIRRSNRKCFISEDFCPLIYPPAVEVGVGKREDLSA